MTLKTEEAIKIAEQIQKDIVDGKVSTQNILRQYYSLVTLIDKRSEIEWSTNELFGYKEVEKIPNYRKASNDQNVVAFIDNNCGTIQAWWLNRDSFVYNIPVSAKKGIISNHIKSEVHVGQETFFYILNTITSLIYTKTQQILLEIKFGKFEFDIFEETRKVVDTELSKKCPTAFEKLTETYENMIKSDSPLAFQQTAHACRVVLKDFADAVYPVSDKKTFIGLDGKSHSIKDDDYINRIVACIQENADSKSDKEFIKNSLIYLGNFLKSINDLASIGTHNEISKEDANKCLIYTYLVFGDIIKLLEKH